MKELAKKESSMKASSLRGLLATLLVILVLGATAGFYYANEILNDLSIDIKKNSPTVASNDSTMKATDKLRDFTSKNKSLSEKVNLLAVSTSESQTKIMADLKKYASDTGVTISNFDFNATSNSSGLNTGQYAQKIVSITVGNPVAFTNLMKFLSLVENNTPIMQPTGISITAVDSTKVKVEPITIRFYVK